ncbi:hypothetical protein M0R79_02875 [Ignavigranum ruoffiae]|uniref:hypothetical protein n=1 Tax=Ignavigranum ruoffiae TaxID=89093 RepID=UPI00204B34B5|nr:hypothetical protein [Ignavigranum ruoffiae]UPQ86339.1 hypothetical protein M0R79_02875 [Ignavigranum ruoffiae]
MIIDTDKITELINSNITGYRINKDTNGAIKQQSHGNYKKGKLDVNNMTLATAIEYMKYINTIKNSTTCSGLCSKNLIKIEKHLTL